MVLSWQKSIESIESLRTDKDEPIDRKFYDSDESTPAEASPQVKATVQSTQTSSFLHLFLQRHPNSRVRSFLGKLKRKTTGKENNLNLQKKSKMELSRFLDPCKRQSNQGFMLQSRGQMISRYLIKLSAETAVNSFRLISSASMTNQNARRPSTVFPR